MSPSRASAYVPISSHQKASSNRARTASARWAQRAPPAVSPRTSASSEAPLPPPRRRSPGSRTIAIGGFANVPVGVEDRVVRVFPSLLNQSGVALSCVLEEPVLIRIAAPQSIRAPPGCAATTGRGTRDRRSVENRRAPASTNSGVASALPWSRPNGISRSAAISPSRISCRIFPGWASCSSEVYITLVRRGRSARRGRGTAPPRATPAP